jgi:hypothetical protein
MATTSDRGGGYELSVSYPIIGRPGLATSWQVDLTRAGGFEEEVVLAVDQRYFRLLDHNTISPAPESETGAGDVVQWTFEPPEGDRLHIEVDARFSPTWSLTEEGSVEVWDGSDVVAAVRFRTWVIP